MHLKHGGKIEIGKKGDRTYNGTGNKVSKAAEAHLASHADKHVRDWAAKTQPNPPTPRERKADPAKVAARAKVREERQAAQATARTAKTEARQADHAERAKAKTERSTAKAAKHEARQAKQAEAVATLQKIGAPVKAGKLDKTRVPGATKSFTPLTSTDPADSYKGRSYKARSAKEMGSELLGAAARGGSNEQIIREQVGHLGVKDPTQWEAISEKYEAKNVNTYEDAIRVLASASTAKGSRQPDWRNFDFETLQSCPGLEHLTPPTWLQDAHTDREAAKHAEKSYTEAQHRDPADTYGDESAQPKAGDAEPEYHPGHVDDDVPFSRV
ncbi:MAG: hypothetical protein ABI445_21895 [Polyangia bacterium]